MKQLYYLHLIFCYHVGLSDICDKEFAKRAEELDFKPPAIDASSLTVESHLRFQNLTEELHQSLDIVDWTAFAHDNNLEHFKAKCLHYIHEGNIKVTLSTDICAYRL